MMSTLEKAIANHYREPESELELEILRAVFGDFIGQRSWALTNDFLAATASLRLNRDSVLLDFGCGFGGPSITIAERVGCRVIGFDVNSQAIAAAGYRANDFGLSKSVVFVSKFEAVADSFDQCGINAILMNDVICHFTDRLKELRRCFDLLSSGDRMLITDPLVVTGALSESEKVVRGPNIVYDYIAHGTNERLMESAGFAILGVTDSTVRLETLSRDYLAKYRQMESGLVGLWGRRKYLTAVGQLEVVHRTSKEKRLSRFTYLLEKK